MCKGQSRNVLLSLHFWRPFLLNSEFLVANLLLPARWVCCSPDCWSQWCLMRSWPSPSQRTPCLPWVDSFLLYSRFLAFDILMMCVKVWLSSSLIYLELIKDFRCVHERFSFSLAVLPIIFQMSSPCPLSSLLPWGLPLCRYFCDWWRPVQYFRVSGHSLFFLSLSLEKVLDASLSLLLPPASSPNVPSSPSGEGLFQVLYFAMVEFLFFFF